MKRRDLTADLGSITSKKNGASGDINYNVLKISVAFFFFKK
jgi:hypothetical protein